MSSLPLSPQGIQVALFPRLPAANSARDSQCLLSAEDGTHNPQLAEDGGSVAGQLREV